MADLSHITIPSGETFNFKDSQARSDLSELRTELGDKTLLVTQVDYTSELDNEDILYLLFVNNTDQTVLTEAEYKALTTKTALFYYIKES